MPGKNLRILICAIADADNNPRPNRIINHLKHKHQVTFLGLGCTDPDVQFSYIHKIHSKFNYFLRNALWFFRLHRLSECLLLELPKNFSFKEFDLIICHDLTLLPFIYQHKIQAQVIFDAREYYPKQYENKFIWRLLDAPFKKYLCRKYLHRVNKNITVSEGLKEAYKKDFNVTMDILYSLPGYIPLDINPCSKPIRIIHHGINSHSRKLERIIEAMDNVNQDFILDLMLVGGPHIITPLQEMAETRNNVNIIPPVEFNKIIPTLNQYDIGLYIRTLSKS